MDMTASQVAKNQAVKIPITPYDATNSDVTPSATAPTGSGDNIGNVELTISKVRKAKPIVWTGEEQLSVGGLVNPIIRDQYAQRMRSLVNEIEEDLCYEATHGAVLKGNIIGTQGTTPFASDMKDLTAVLKKLQDNGAPTSDLQAVLNTSAGMNLRNLSNLFKVNEAGNSNMLTRGLLGQLYGFNIRESAGFKKFAKGAGTGYLLNGATAVGDTEITVDTGTGAIKAGDIITIAGDTTKYVVAEDVASGGTTIKLGNAIEKVNADNSAVTVGADYTPNACFSRGSILLATRVPAVPKGGDIAIDRTVITDDVSGLSFEVALWGGAYQNTVTISSAWGCKNIKPEHTVALLG